MSIRVLVCGSGNTAHVFACLLAANPDVELRVFTRDQDKATAWNSAISKAPMRLTKREDNADREITRAVPALVSDQPELARDSDLIILAVPAYGHTAYLKLLAPYVEDGASIVGLPGHGGFELEVRRILGDRPVMIVNFESSPWSCRIVEFGRHIRIRGVKQQLLGAAQGDLSHSRIADPLACMESLIGDWTTVVSSPNILSITLMSVNAYSHPPIMYATWKNWSGQSFTAPPLFYHAIDEATGGLIASMSDEVVEIGRQIMRAHPEQDLSHVVPMLTWDRNSYHHEIGDDSSQYAAFRTNRVYRDSIHPMRDNGSGNWIPDFEHRYLTEDVPHGLVPIRGIAELAGVSTPKIDEVLRWCQTRIGKHYLSNGTLSGKDISSTSCPQRYGIKTLGEIL